MVEELFPASVAMVAEVDVDEGVVARSNGLFDELHVGFLWGSAALLDVALGAGTDDVFPDGLAAHAPGDNVVEG